MEDQVQAEHIAPPAPTAHRRHRPVAARYIETPADHRVRQPAEGVKNPELADAERLVERRLRLDVAPPRACRQQLEHEVRHLALLPDLVGQPVPASRGKRHEHVGNDHRRPVAALEEHAQIRRHQHLPPRRVAYPQCGLRVRPQVVVDGALHRLAVAEGIAVVVKLDRRHGPVEGARMHTGEGFVPPRPGGAGGSLLFVDPRLRGRWPVVHDPNVPQVSLHPWPVRQHPPFRAGRVSDIAPGSRGTLALFTTEGR